MEVGIDCIDISRFDTSVFSKEGFLDNIFTKNEIQYCIGTAKPSQHFAVRFAGKEAVIKALSPHNIKISYNEIEIVNDNRGIPAVVILKEGFDSFKFKISLSHSKDIAMAVALVFR